MLSLNLLCKYPFLHEAREWVGEHGPAMEELFYEHLYSGARRIGVERVREALETSSVGRRPIISEIELEMELLSYPLARMLVAAIKDPYLARRYAMGEAKSAHESMLGEPLDFVMHVAAQFDIEAFVDDDGEEVHHSPPLGGGVSEFHSREPLAKFVNIHFSDYLKNAPARDKNWKLVNRKLRAGRVVEVSKKELARLVQEALRRRLEGELEKARAPPEAMDVFKSDIIALKNAAKLKREEFEGEGFGKVTIEIFPPCIKALLGAIQAGINVPHAGRFATVAFLHTIGMNSDEILALFATSPDFDVERSRYQVEHITGAGSGTEYSPPGCHAMTTFGICPTEKMDGLCRKVKHPLSYYRVKKRDEAKRTPKKQSGDAGGSENKAKEGEDKTNTEKKSPTASADIGESDPDAAAGSGLQGDAEREADI